MRSQRQGSRAASIVRTLPLHFVPLTGDRPSDGRRGAPGHWRTNAPLHASGGRTPDHTIANGKARHSALTRARAEAATTCQRGRRHPACRRRQAVAVATSHSASTPRDARGTRLYPPRSQRQSISRDHQSDQGISTPAAQRRRCHGRGLAAIELPRPHCGQRTFRQRTFPMRGDPTN